MINIDRWLKENINEIISHRRWLHQHPEVGFEEFKTSEYCKYKTRDYGFIPIQVDSMKTGFYVDVGSPGDKNIALRCDMDALPIKEKGNNSYKSLNSGFSHACGHDVHMAIQLGVMKYFSDVKDINGLIRFIFQPAEEMAPGGALSMINSGAIDGIDMILGGHVQPQIETGYVGVKDGAIAAHVDIIEIELSGPGGHTSRPEKSVDLILYGSKLVQILDLKINKKLSKQTPVVISFGSIAGGFTFNVIPTTLKMQGTLRYLDVDKSEHIFSVVNQAIKEISEDSKVSINFRVLDSSPVLKNNSKLHNIVRDNAIDVLGNDKVIDLDESSMGGEDFAYYLEHIDGYYLRIGSFDGVTTDIHTDTFDVDERCISTAIKTYVTSILSYLNS